MPKTSFDYMWELLNPPADQQNTKDACRAYWNALTLQRQRLLYYYLRKQLREGIKLHRVPLFVLKDCNPVPTNYNAQNLPKNVPMCIAFYDGVYGVYTREEATLFGLKIKSALQAGN